MRCRGPFAISATVTPFLVTASILAPLDIKYRIIALSPLAAALWRAVKPPSRFLPPCGCCCCCCGCCCCCCGCCCCCCGCCCCCCCCAACCAGAAVPSAAGWAGCAALVAGAAPPAGAGVA